VAVLAYAGSYVVSVRRPLERRRPTELNTEST
jgi:hypothetical protein